MASRKFLDLTGLDTLVNNIKTLLAGKQDTLTQGSNITISSNTISATDTTYDNATTAVAGLMSSTDKTKLDNTFKELTGSQARIWDLDEGTYKTPENFTIFYQGASGRNFFTAVTSGYLIVTKSSTTHKEFIMFAGASGSSFNLYTGYSSQSTGFKQTFNLGQTFLTTNQVKNNLTYSTSDTNYALSAYQGYVLNQNKADKTEIPANTSDLINDSGFISSTDGEVIKQLADGNINIWTLDSGTYSLPTTGYIYYDPDDNTKRVQINSGGLLLIDKQDNNVNKYVLYMNRIIMYGMTDTIGGLSAATINTCQSIQNKVTSISSSSTDTQYPSAKAVYDFAGGHYSTTERVIGTWIDGKPLYRKTVTGTTSTSSSEVSITKANISADLDDIYSVTGIIKQSNGEFHPIPYWKGSNDYANWYGNSSAIVVQSGTAHGYGSFALNIEYTKTTD